MNSVHLDKILEGFEPDFDFKSADPVPRAEFEERVRRIRREATEDEYDIFLFHIDQNGF
jgi:hypothetical protein